MNAVSLLQKFAKKGMVGSTPTAMDARKKRKAAKSTGGKKKTGGKKRRTSKK